MIIVSRVMEKQTPLTGLTGLRRAASARSSPSAIRSRSPTRSRRSTRGRRRAAARHEARHRGAASGVSPRARASAAGAAAAAGLPDTTPRTTAAEAASSRRTPKSLDACDGFLRRAAIEASLTRDERLEILRGMMLTRATDNRLKAFFTGGEVRYGSAPFQGKGFRSLGQEAIYAAGDPAAPRRRVSRRRRALDRRRHRAGDSRSRRHARDASGRRHGAHGAERADGQGRPADRRQGPARRRFRLGHPAAGGAADDRDADDGRHGDGVLRATDRAASRCRSSAKADRRSANGTRRSTCAPRAGCRRSSASRTIRPRCRRRVAEQSAVRVFADKAVGYGIPGITIDGTDPDAIAAAFAWAAERARAGEGPTLIELVSMRMCGHAHHDDMLYLGKEPQPSWEYPPLDRAGLRRIASSTSTGPRAIRFATYAATARARRRHRRRRSRSLQAGGRGDRRARGARGHRRAVAGSRASAGVGVFADEPPRVHVEVLDPERSRHASRGRSRTGRVDRRSRRRRSTRKGRTLSRRGDARRRRRAARRSARVRLRRGRRRQLRQRVSAAAAAARRSSAIASSTRRSPKARCSASASARRSPASGRSARCSSTTSSRPASISSSTTPRRSATAGAASVPMVVRMPWGGLRHAGPYHTQNTEAVVLPDAGPEDRRAVDAARRARADGVGGRRSRSGALLRAHRALSRSANQAAARDDAARADSARPRGAAPRRRRSRDRSYGAYVHVATARRRDAGAGRHRGERARSAHARRRSTARRCSRSRATATAC